MEKHNLICIVCPIGCRLTLVKDENEEKGYRIEGNNCTRGTKYGIDEMTNPTRMIPTTVKIRNGLLNRLPVRTQSPIPKSLIFECMKEINQVEVVAPIKIGDIVLKNVCNTGVDIIATRSMDVK